MGVGGGVGGWVCPGEGLIPGLLSSFSANIRARTPGTCACSTACRNFCLFFSISCATRAARAEKVECECECGGAAEEEVEEKKEADGKEDEEEG